MSLRPQPQPSRIVIPIGDEGLPAHLRSMDADRTERNERTERKGALRSLSRKFSEWNDADAELSEQGGDTLSATLGATEPASSSKWGRKASLPETAYVQHSKPLHTIDYERTENGGGYFLFFISFYLLKVSV